MRTDHDDLEERIRSAFRYRAERTPDTPNAATPLPRPHRSRRTAIRLLTVAAAVVVLLAGLAVWRVSSDSDNHVNVSTAGDACAALDSSVGSGVDGQPTPEQAQCLAQQKLDYDPAEVAYLNAEADANDPGWVPDDQYLVSTLEYRRACRLTMRLANETASDAAPSRASTIDRVMPPELERLVSRTPTGDESAKMFRELADQLKAGEHDRVVTWLNNNCADALRWTQSP
jgi:hypothetical protein